MFRDSSKPVDPGANAESIVTDGKKGPFRWTPERERFVELWVSTHNAAEAYKLSHGSTDKDGKELRYQTLAKRGERLLRHPAVIPEVTSREAPFWRLFPLSVDGILEEATIIAFANMGDYFDFTGETITLKPAKKIPRWAQAAIQQLTVDRRRTRKKTDEMDAEGNPVYVEIVHEKINLKLYQKSGQLEFLARKFGVGEPKNVAHDIIRLLPPELRIQVATIILAKLDEQKKGKAAKYGM